MKKLLSLLPLIALSLGFSSCCSMFGLPAGGAGYTTETHQVKTSSYETVTEEIYVEDSSGKGGMMQTVEKQVPGYKTVTRRVRVPCQKCVRRYCPKKDCCGSTSEEYLKMVTAQGPTGSPFIGLVPTMRKLAE